MRVADSVTSSIVGNNIQRSTARMNRLQTELSTGTVIQNASDDPLGASTALMLRSGIRNVEQYQRNADDGLGHMNYVDSVMNDMVNALTESYGTAVQGASDTVNPADRKILADQVNQTLEFMLRLSQSKYNGDYVFSGTETSETPYEAVRDADGNIVSVGTGIRRSLAFSDTGTAVGTSLGLTNPPSGTVTIGDKSVSIDLATDSLDAIKAKIDAAAPTGVTVNIESSIANGATVYRLKINGTTTVSDQNDVLGTLGIGNVDTTNGIYRAVDDGVKVQLNVPGRDLFEGAQNPFSALIKLRDSLENNDKDGINQSITDMNAARARVSDARGVLGARTNRMQLSQSLLGQFQVSLSDSLSKTEDVDVAQAVLNLQQEQNVFQSALISGKTITQPSLLDFLR